MSWSTFDFLLIIIGRQMVSVLLLCDSSEKVIVKLQCCKVKTIVYGECSR